MFLKRFKKIEDPKKTFVIVHGLGEHSGRYKFLIDKNLLKNEKFLREHIIGEFANAIIICVSTESKSLKQYLPPPKRKEYNWVTLRNLVGRPCSGDNPFLLIRKSDLSLI